MDDSIYRLRNHDFLLLVLLALLGISVIMVQSASIGVTGQSTWQFTELGGKQAVYATVAAVAYLVFSRIDYVRLAPKKIPWMIAPPMLLVAIAALACALVLIPHVGIEKNGARRWLPLGVMQVQPSELAKWAVVIFLAWWLVHRPLNVERFGVFLLTLVPVCVLCLLVVVQDFGTAALIATVALSMLFVGRAKLWHLSVIVPPALALAYWFVAHKEYRWKRMTAFLDPYAAPQGDGYHMIQSLLSFATGGLGGTGLGGGIQKLGYLPEDTTDFIFATICEELGLAGAAVVIGLYAAMLVLAWQAVKAPRDSFGRLLAFGIAMMVATQAAINVAVATVSVPTKGLSLPLISSGGSGLIITAAALGVLGSILRHPHTEPLATTRPARRPGKAGVVDEKLWSQWTTA
ncbi:MAG TPA: FtsW/RodA/SpoVE family cell cycle protein [Tepidisphaeraceae bacterium]|jgi:cell division protein FtsW